MKVGVGDKLSGDLKLYKWLHIDSVCFHSLSSSVFRFLLVALFHHLSHVLCKSHLIFPVKGMAPFYLPQLPFPILLHVPPSS